MHITILTEFIIIKISLDEMKISDERVNRKFYHFLRELENLGYIKISGNYITSVKKLMPLLRILLL